MQHVGWRLAAVAVFALAGRMTMAAQSEPVAPVLQRPAVQSGLAAHAVLLAVTRAGPRLVAVGERGIVVLSDDSGRTWRQAAVPVSITLTAVAFPTPADGWAVGHSGAILHTHDGGATWAKQFDGIRAARAALADARANLRAGATSRRRNDLVQARQLVADGPDKPFLSVRFTDARHGLVTGAYGLVFATSDGGATWRPWMSRIDNPDRRHIYASAQHGDALYLAGEQGFFARSIDGGSSFARIATPYRGTFFVLAAASSGELLIAGLRSHALRSSDGGRTFASLATPVADAYDAFAAVDRAFVLANTAGVLVRWQPGTPSLVPLMGTTAALPPLAGVAAAPDGALIAVGVAGALRLDARPPSI